MQKIFLARQPIVDRNDNLFAFELLFRSADRTTAGVVDSDCNSKQQNLN